MNSPERDNFIQNDRECKIALTELFNNADVNSWLTRYQGLYDSVTISPKGLPSITSVHLADDHFEHIALFGHLFRTLQDCREHLMTGQADL